MATVSTAPTVDALAQGLRGRISALQICADLRGGWDKDTAVEFGQLRQELQSMKQDVRNCKGVLNQAKADLAVARALMERMQGLSSRLTHMKTNLPAHLPNAKKPAVATVETNQPAAEEKTSKKDNTSNSASHEKGPAAKKAGGKTPIPAIQFVEVEEFSNVPKYIKGRLQYEQVNTAVKEYNKALERKYTLMRRPRAKLSDVDMKIVTACRQHENQDTKDFFFVVDADLKRWSSLKLDSNGRSIMTLLRTLKRVREVRSSGNLVRYVVQ